MDLSISQLEALRVELKDYLGTGNYAEFFLKISHLPFLEGLAHHKNDYIHNHFPNGLHIFRQQVEVLAMDCIAQEITRLQANKQAEQRAVVSPQEAEAEAEKCFERGSLAQDMLEKIKAYSEAIKYKPDFAEAYYLRGEAKFSLEQYPEAIEDYDQVIALVPEGPWAYYWRAGAYSALRNKEKALDSLRTFIQLGEEKDWAKDAPIFAWLRNDSDFKALIS